MNNEEALSEAEKLVKAVAEAYDVSIEDAKVGILSNWTAAWCKAIPMHGKVSDYCDARGALSKLALSVDITLAELLDGVN